MASALSTTTRAVSKADQALVSLINQQYDRHGVQYVSGSLIRPLSGEVTALEIVNARRALLRSDLVEEVKTPLLDKTTEMLIWHANAALEKHGMSPLPEPTVLKTKEKAQNQADEPRIPVLYDEAGLFR